MFEKELENIFVEFWKYTPRYLYRKDYEEYYKANKSLAIIGPRRAGKSYCLYQIKDYLIKHKNLKTEDFIYINFEDLRLKGFGHKNFQEITNTYESIFSERKPIIMLDEIQNVNFWYKYARDLVDKGYLTYITGSNSKMISKEIAAHLGARYLPLTILPFSFKEYLKFKNIGVEKKDLSTNKNKILQEFKTFLEYGGYPEIINNTEKIKKETLKTYFDLTIGDIVKRRDLKDEQALELTIKKIKENLTKESTIKNYINFFKSINHKIDDREIYKYFTYLLDSFLIVELENKKKSLKTRSYLKKYYFLDNGFISLFSPEEDLGQKIENLFLTEILKKKLQIKYYKNKFECDFIVKGQKEMAIQITYEINNENKDRETKGILNAINDLNLNHGIIITYNQEETIIINNKKIEIIPMWKWILSN